MTTQTETKEEARNRFEEAAKVVYKVGDKVLVHSDKYSGIVKEVYTGKLAGCYSVDLGRPGSIAVWASEMVRRSV